MPTAPLPRPTETRTSASGTALLVAFTLATLVGIVPIVMIGTYGTWASVAVAVGSLIALAGLIVVLLSRYLGE